MIGSISLTNDIKTHLLTAGAAKVGFCNLDMQNLHIKNGYHTAISILALLTPSEIKTIGQGPDHKYYFEYKNLNKKLTNLSNSTIELLKNKGFEAYGLEPIIGSRDKTDKETINPHKTFAYRSGLGWIGKSSLLVTKEFGSAFRLATVVTNAPLKINETIHRNYCGSCAICTDSCPALAIKGIIWNQNLKRDEYFNANACFEKIKSFMSDLKIDAPVCGICMRQCPWTDFYVKRSI